MLIADRLSVPDDTSALLCDMDGVLLDTVAMDCEIVNRLLGAHQVAEVPRQIIREYFPYDIPEFWRLLIGRIGLKIPQEPFDELVREHSKARESSAAAVHDGVAEILADAQARGLMTAVVSNNPEAEVEHMLALAGLRDYFGAVVGNDNPGIAKKPAPDTYLEAARRLSGPASCAALEDSLTGAQAASAAGCFTVGVATGAADFASLSASPYVDRCYDRFAPCQVALGRDGALVTPDEFVSHMIGQIARGLGCSVDVVWTNDDWNQLGHELGCRAAGLRASRGTAVAPGVILRGNGAGDVRLRGAGQLADGRPLVSMLEGLATGCGVDLEVLGTSAEDPRHAWEGIFRGVGIGLSKLAVGGSDEN